MFRIQAQVKVARVIKVIKRTAEICGYKIDFLDYQKHSGVIIFQPHKEHVGPTKSDVDYFLENFVFALAFAELGERVDAKTVRRKISNQSDTTDKSLGNHIYVIQVEIK